MNNKESRLRKFARCLIVHAVKALPDDRSEWAQAMLHEVDHITNDNTAIRWALGCVFACYLERMNVMKTGDFHISRVVLSLEMLMCFGPISFGLFSFILSSFNLIPPPAFLLFLLPSYLVGPIGLFIAFRLIVLERISMSRTMMLVLSIFAAWTFIGNSIFMLYVSNPADIWRGLILLAILPALGAVHLIYMSNPERKVLTAA